MTNKMPKIVSFQIAQATSPGPDGIRGWTPDIVALCEDGSLWTINLKDFQSHGVHFWSRMTPEQES